MNRSRELQLKFLFMFCMSFCFVLQSLDNFKKFIDGKTSMTSSEIERESETLPSFSLCSDPPFDKEYMSNTLNISSSLFLSTTFMSKYAKKYKFPENLSEDFNDFNSLESIYERSILEPFMILIGTPNDIIIYDQFAQDLERIELEEFKIIRSPWFGKCKNFVLKKPKTSTDELPILIRFPRFVSYQCICNTQQIPDTL